jgi:hypothetical protein
MRQQSEIWGLNHLQDMKGDPVEFPGAYDHKKEPGSKHEPIHKTSYSKTWESRRTNGGRDQQTVSDMQQD